MKNFNKLAILFMAIIIIIISTTIFVGCNDVEEDIPVRKKILEREPGELFVSYRYADNIQNLFRTTDLSKGVRWLRSIDSCIVLNEKFYIEENLYNDRIISVDTRDSSVRLRGVGGDTLLLCNIADITNGISFDIVVQDTTRFYVEFDSLTRANFFATLINDIVPQKSLPFFYKSANPLFWIVAIETVIVLVATVKECSEEKQRECDKKIADGVRNCKRQNKDSKLVGKCSVECVSRKN